MSQFEEKYDLIARYLKGDLSEQELQRFEQEMSTDPELANEVDAQRLSMQVVEHAYLQDMSALVKQTVEAKGANETIKPKKPWWLLGVGLLAVLSAVFLVEDDSFSEDVADAPEQQIQELKDVSVEVQLEERSKSKETVETAKQNEQEVEEVTLNAVEDKPNEEVFDSLTMKVEELVTGEEEEPALVEKKEEGPVIQPLPMKEEVVCDYEKVEIKVRNAAIGESDGVLVLPELQGAVYVINQGEYEASYDLDGLEAGVYDIQIVDKRGCKVNKGMFEIKQEPCLRQRDYTFSPSYDGTISWKVSEDEKLEITILNKIGQQVYTSNMEGEPFFEWDGSYNSGDQATVGLHKVIIKSTSKENCIYNLVISK